MTVRLAKMTSKNQLTIPAWAVRALGEPTHFRVLVHDGVLILWPGKIVCPGLPPGGKAVARANTQGSTGKPGR